FTGWNDAADAASNAVRNLIEGWGATALAEIDPEPFTDYATVRPHVRLKDGGKRDIIWPTVGLWHVNGAGGDIILALGPEPSLRWKLFSQQIISVAEHFNSSLLLTLGSLLADVPHSRPVQIIGTATDTDLIERFDLQRSRYEGPVGIVSVLHDTFDESSIPSASLWAAVPAYASQVPSPKASLALMRRACEIIGTPAPLATVMNLIERYEEQIDAEIDPEPFTDYATVRPHVRLKDGGKRDIIWPTVGLWHVNGAGGDIILALGPEPSLRWKLFSQQIISVAEHFNSSLLLTLGSLLADVPHSRPVQIIGTATDTDLIERFDLQRSRYEGPVGIVSVLHDTFDESSIPSASLWAAVPAYASQVPSPKASLALMRRACEIIGTPAPLATVMNLIERY
ncbi:MAG: hypothetical protein ABR56_05140, partial [Acidimicrobium sp. BACL27 MAG-120823-bin4]